MIVVYLNKKRVNHQIRPCIYIWDLQIIFSIMPKIPFVNCDLKINSIFFKSIYMLKKLES